MDGKSKPIPGVSGCSPGATCESRCVPGASSTRKAPPARRVRPAANGSVDQITADLVRNVQALVKAVQDQEHEVAQLRGRLERVRGLLG